VPSLLHHPRRNRATQGEPEQPQLGIQVLRCGVRYAHRLTKNTAKPIEYA
jgi:hypothetical protein